MTAVTFLIILALVFGFYMAWNIGANDVANAMGTSVGSGALTLRNAIILAAIFEFAGAFLVGSHVSETVRKGIFSPRLLQQQEIAQAMPDKSTDEIKALSDYLTAGHVDDVANAQIKDNRVDVNGFSITPGERDALLDANRRAAMRLACGMIAALLAAGIWLQVASYFGWPVSTTHAIVGAVVGFGAVAVGIDQIKWAAVSQIAASWLVSPVLAAAISYLVFRFILRQIFFQADPVAAARRITPGLVAMVICVMAAVTSFKALKGFWKDQGLAGSHWPWTFTIVVGFVGAGIGALVARRLVSRMQSDPIPEESRFSAVFVARSLDKALKHLRRVKESTVGEMQVEAEHLLRQTEELNQVAESQVNHQMTQSAYRKVERIFIYLQIVSACFVAFAHGANDVANAIGPLSAAVQSLRQGIVATQAAVPQWALLLGGVGIVFGLATWGWRVMQTIGRRITELTPSRGFAAEFAAAITILVATLFGLPISTTHTLVGAVIGVGIARGIGAINLNTLRDIVASWIITLPAGAGLAILFYFVLQLFVA